MINGRNFFGETVKNNLRTYKITLERLRVVKEMITQQVIY